MLAGGFCAPGCACANCRNHADEAAVVQQARAVVLAKDPQAFEKKASARVVVVHVCVCVWRGWMGQAAAWCCSCWL